MANPNQNNGPGGQQNNRPPVTQSVAPKGENVTYVPGEGDPASIRWRGLTFHANIPLLITDEFHLLAAKGNKFFKVGEFKPGDAVPVEETGLPKTSDQYRAHCVAWLKKVETTDELNRRWEGEEMLRRDCGVGTDDYDYLSSLLTPKRAELKKRDLEMH